MLIEYGANSRASGLAVPIHHAGAAIATAPAVRERATFHKADCFVCSKSHLFLCMFHFSILYTSILHVLSRNPDEFSYPSHRINFMMQQLHLRTCLTSKSHLHSVHVAPLHTVHILLNLLSNKLYDFLVLAVPI